MRHKRDEGLLVLLMEASARLPWWLSLLAAAAIYLLLHAWANHVEPAPKGLAGLGAYAGLQLWRTLALFGQYLVPAVLGIGAVVSVIKSRQCRRRYEQTAALGTASALLDMSWRQFEDLVREHFRREGYSVTAAAGAGPDGGTDLALQRQGERFLVQCKQWRAYRVGVDVVRQLYGVMAARGAVGGFVVSAGQFTADACKFVEGRNIELIDGAQLAARMRAVTGRAPASPQSAAIRRP